jgi:hypothetical protein
MLTGTTIWFSRALEHSRGKAYSVVVGNARLCTCGELLAVLSLEINVPTGPSCGAAGPTLPPTFSGGRRHRIPCAALACVDWMSCETPNGTLLELYGSRQSHGVWIIRRSHPGQTAWRSVGTARYSGVAAAYWRVLRLHVGRYWTNGTPRLGRTTTILWLPLAACIRGALRYAWASHVVCRVHVRCRRQQFMPGGLRADRDSGGVPHRGRRRGQDRGGPFRGRLLYRPAGLLLLYKRQQCVLQHRPGRRRLLYRPAAVRRCHRTNRCAAVRALLSLFWGQCVELSLA